MTYTIMTIIGIASANESLSSILEKQTRVFKDIEHLEVLDKKHLNNLKK